MKKICDEFRNASDYVFKWFESKQNVKEESFTDWLLYYLSNNLTNFNYREYSRHQENKISGADFDFWIVGVTQHLKFRIQAKKLKKTGNHYDAITYPDQTKHQINLLLSSSRQQARPFYLFYNNSAQSINRSKCGLIRSGTLLIDAAEINSRFLNNGITAITRQDLVSISVPLECLFCCLIGKPSENIFSNVKKIIDIFFPTNTDTSIPNNLIPDYINDITNTDITDEQWQEKSQNKVDDNVRYIALLDLRFEKEII